MSWKEFYHNKWTRFIFWTLAYLLWVIWLGNFWWLFGLIVIFDTHITQKVKWTFWKKDYKEGEKRNILLEWLDAIIFAVVVVSFINIFFFQAFKIPSSSMESSLLTGDHLFVSKLSYGPRTPSTPLTIPFTHNVLPSGKESYTELWTKETKRLKGFGDVERGDYVVFGFPHGDTVLTKAPTDDYYTLVRSMGRDYTIQNFGPVKVRPMDKKDHYVKRCVAVAGDTLSVIDGQVYINSQAQDVYEGLQMTYTVVTNGNRINSKNLDGLGLNIGELWFDAASATYPMMPLTAEMLGKVKMFSNVVSVSENIDNYPPDYPDSYLTIFPFSKDFKWTRDNLGPLWIPKQGETVELTVNNLPLYHRIITAYEGNKLEVKEGVIFINSEEVQTYTFKQDYFFMMGDNRHNSLDSRYWGFVPEDHVVGKPVVVWFSSDGNKAFPKNIRWSRFFKFV